MYIRVTFVILWQMGEPFEEEYERKKEHKSSFDGKRLKGRYLALVYFFNFGNPIIKFYHRSREVKRRFVA